MINFNNEKIISDKNIIKKINIPKRNYQEKNQNWIPAKKSHRKLIRFSLISILFFIAFLFFNFYTYSASFEVQPKIKDIKLNNDIFEANNEVVEEKGKINFQIWKTNFSLSKEVKAKMTEKVQKQAIGKIKIINKTNKAQKLRKETRFETSDGKLYKIYKSITIPANSSMVREAFADKAGEKFNLKKGVKLTIPGFKEVKNINLYKNITGEVAEDFKGGFIGTELIADEEDYKNKKAELEKEIEKIVIDKTIKDIPENYILNNDGIFKKISYKTIKENDKNILKADVDLYAIIFKKDDFLSLISGFSKDLIKNYKIDSTSFLKFKILDKENLDDVNNIKKFNFKLNGKVRYIKLFNQKEFKKEILGLNKERLNSILEEKYSSDYKINYSIIPFWKNKIPEDLNKIKIEILEEK